MDIVLKSIPGSTKLVRAIARTAAGELELLNAWYPTAIAPRNSSGLAVHISSVRFFGCGHAFGDKESRSLVRAHLRECRAGFRCRVHRASTYDWAALFSREFEPIEYQLAGMDRLWARCMRWQHGCLLGDDVGLGKTVQSLAVYLRGVKERSFPKGKQRGIYITKASLKMQLGEELSRFAPSLKVSVAEGSYDERMAALRSRWHLLVVNYEMLIDGRYGPALRSLLADRVGFVCLDEASRLKNPASKTHQSVCEMVRPVPARIVMDATPLENSVLDCWGKLRACDPHLLGTASLFAARYLQVRNRRVVASRNLKEFRARTASVVLRRTRSACGVQVPDVCSVIRDAPLGKEQAKQYRSFVSNYRGCTARGAVSLRALHRVCLASLVADASDPASPSSKLDDLVDLLEGELSHERVVVFTRYASAAQIAAERLARFAPLVISGKVPVRRRHANAKAFNDPGTPNRVLVCTEAADSGLNLQGGGVVVNLDLPWNAAKLRQRVGRVNRIGQKRKSVLVVNYRATVPGVRTVDDWFAETVIRKRDIFRQGVGDDESIDEVGNESVDEDSLMRFIGS